MREGDDGRPFVSDRRSCLLLLLLWSMLHGPSVSPLLFHRELYSQFLREMIIQPGIAKANMGVSREDVTFEDHVSKDDSRDRGYRVGRDAGCGAGKFPQPRRTGGANLGPLLACPVPPFCVGPLGP